MIEGDPQTIADAAADKGFIANGSHVGTERTEQTDLDRATEGGHSDSRAIGEATGDVGGRDLTSGYEAGWHCHVAVKAGVEEGLHIEAVLTNYQVQGKV